MSRAIQSVSHYMSAAPHTIGVEQSLAKARDMMNEHRIRHLPVLHGNQLVGVLSDRDIALAEAFAPDANDVKVEEAMTQDVLEVGPKQLLDEVVEAMAARKLGSAVVVEHHKVVGIFTSIDVMHALVGQLHAGCKGCA